MEMSQHVLVKDAVIINDAILSTDAENSKKTFEMLGSKSECASGHPK